MPFNHSPLSSCITTCLAAMCRSCRWRTALCGTSASRCRKRFAHGCLVISVCLRPQMRSMKPIRQGCSSCDLRRGELSHRERLRKSASKRPTRFATGFGREPNKHTFSGSPPPIAATVHIPVYNGGQSHLVCISSTLLMDMRVHRAGVLLLCAQRPGPAG